MLLGAAGAIIPFFFLKWSENITGFMAFGLAALGLIVGSLIGKASKPGAEAVEFNRAAMEEV